MLQRSGTGRFETLGRVTFSSTEASPDRNGTPVPDGDGSPGCRRPVSEYEGRFVLPIG